MSVAILNFIMQYALIGLSMFQKFTSKTEEEMSAMFKVFLSMTINMILLVLMTNLDFSSSSFFAYIHTNIPLGNYIFNGTVTDFTRSYYLKVGTTIIILMAITVVWPHILDVFFWWPLRRCQQCCCTGSIILQADLNEKYEGYQFSLWSRYAYTLTIVYFVMTFSPGLPLMFPLGAAFFFFIYWIDKCMSKLLYFINLIVLRFYKKPPAFTTKINTRAFNILPYCVLLHAIISLFVYTNPEIYPQETSTSTTYVSGQVTTVYTGSYMSYGQRVFINFNYN